MIDFGLVDAVDADAVGPPAQRHFRLRARTGDQYASLWLEKEQLNEIGRIFSRLLSERSRRNPKNKLNMLAISECISGSDFVVHETNVFSRQ